MKKILLNILSVLFAYLLAPSTCMSIPLNYSANGTVVDKQGNMLVISGWINIDNQLRSWASCGPGQPVTLVNDLGQYTYQYYITGYSLTVGEYNFSGNYGYLYMPLFRYPALDNIGLGDLMWFLNDGFGAWNQWIGEEFTFYDNYGYVQDPSQYTQLADLIEFNALGYNSNDPIIPDFGGNFNLWLARQTTDPIPEPSTILLLVASLLGMLGYQKYVFKRRQFL